ncbi:MAG: VWA domain-containing protein [Acidimicrobiia bacterium]
MSGALTERIIRFGRHLRGEGLSVAPPDGALLLEATAIVGLASRADLKAALCSIAVRNREELPVFDAAFDLYFGGDVTVAVPDNVQPLPESAAMYGPSGEGETTGTAAYRVGGSHEERLGARDFADLDDAALAEVKRRLASLMWRPAETLSRRWEPARLGAKPDLRRSFRSWVGPTADLMLMSARRRRRRRRPLVVIADISGSMERYVEVLLAFMHAARGRLGTLEAFVFSTRLTRITQQLAARNLAGSLAAVAAKVQDWSGGTRIGEALETFNRDWSRRVTRGGPVCLVVSDGWDTGDPHLLATEMARLARSVHRVIWLNPLAGSSGYEPATRGMRAVLPHVDDLLPVANLSDVAEVVRLLESIPARR